MRLPPPQHQSPASGFTMLEVVVTITILLVLGAIAAAGYERCKIQGKIGVSISNLRQLALANIAYASDNNGSYCPSQDKRNRIRWHGVRQGNSFDPSRGFLAPYLGRSGRVKICPLFKDFITTADSWELGSGGYGYNAAYIGGSVARTGKYYLPEHINNVYYPSRTVMFTTSAFGSGEKLQEYPYTEPPKAVRKGGRLSGAMQPSTHFRANGKALVAWCDGHVTAEAPGKQSGATTTYVFNGQEQVLGWFGPTAENGYWNPKAPQSVFVAR
ncbi:MAG: type II secretion system protein [Verrucomicrobiales bacterium]